MSFIVKKGSHFFDQKSTITYYAQRAVSDDEGNEISKEYSQIAHGVDVLEMQNNAAFHNSIFMGRDITEKYTNGSLYTKIADGSFEDIFVGDYIRVTYNGAEKVFRIAGLNVYYNDGDNSILTRGHAVLVPDEPLANSAMNSSDTSANGYSGSGIRSGVIATINTNLATPFGSHLITKRELITTAVTSSVSAGLPSLSGTSSNWAWVNSIADLMTETEVYGTVVFGSSGYDVASGYTQLPLFSLAPEYIHLGYSFWIRSVVSTAKFALCSEKGYAGEGNASLVCGVRPRIIIG